MKTDNENGIISKTPLTDMNTFNQYWDGRRTDTSGACVKADFCRTIEKLLTASQAKNAELKEEIARLNQEPLFSRRLIPKLLGQRDQLKQLVHDFELFVDNHKTWCDFYLNKGKCNCGYDELLAKYAALTKEIV